jgi:hypothetical protein
MPGRKRDPINTPVDAPDNPILNKEAENAEASDVQKKSPRRGKIGKAHNSRSIKSIVKGGDNEYQGEPPEGYGTVAPGKQNAGKR